MKTKPHVSLAVLAATFSFAGASLFSEGVSRADTPSAPAKDELSGFVVEGQQGERILPKLAVIPSLAAEIEDVTVHSVVRHDLELSGEFDVLSDDLAPEGSFMSGAVDVKAWKAKGAEDLVRVSGRKQSDGTVELHAEAFIASTGSDPVYDKKFIVPGSDVRVESHRLADLLIGAFTGQKGGFASHMTFALGTGTVRQVFTMDSDGFNAKSVSPSDRVALAPTFGPNDDVYYAASLNKDVYKVFTGVSSTPVSLNVSGSVYGIVFSPDRSQVAVAIGQSDSIKMFSGPSLDKLTSASNVGMALHPMFTPGGKLAFAGEGKMGMRIYVDGKAITPDGLLASSPTFCRNPDGNRVVFAAGNGMSTDLVATGENGGQMVRLTQNGGSNGSPACSPDGRLVAFFSTKKSGQGPGLYIMRLDGGHAQRVTSLVGDSLRWEPLPPGKISDPNAVKAKSTATQ